MSAAESISLLGWVRTPILVGDPDGCIVYANAAFRSTFCEADDDPMGRPLAMVFGGGAREAVLSATASVLQRGQSARIQIREADRAYGGLASPIEAEDDRVGVIIVLLEEASAEDQLAGLADEVAGPLADGLQSVQLAASQTRDTLRREPREHLERGLHALEEAQRALRELQVTLRSGKAKHGRFDVASVIGRVADRLRQERGPELELEVLVAPNLPRAAGTAAVFERLLTQLLRVRLEESRPDQPLTLLARGLGGDASHGLLVSLVDVPDNTRRSATGLPPESVQQGMAVLGGEAVCVEDSLLGRVTGLRLDVPRA